MTGPGRMWKKRQKKFSPRSTVSMDLPFRLARCLIHWKCTYGAMELRLWMRTVNWMVISIVRNPLKCLKSSRIWKKTACCMRPKKADKAKCWAARRQCMSMEHGRSSSLKKKDSIMVSHRFRNLKGPNIPSVSSIRLVSQFPKPVNTKMRHGNS